MKIGSPADSLNSLVVNAVDSEGSRHPIQELALYYPFS